MIDLQLTIPLVYWKNQRCKYVYCIENTMHRHFRQPPNQKYVVDQRAAYEMCADTRNSRDGLLQTFRYRYTAVASVVVRLQGS